MLWTFIIFAIALPSFVKKKNISFFSLENYLWPTLAAAAAKSLQ